MQFRRLTVVNLYPSARPPASSPSLQCGITWPGSSPPTRSWTSPLPSSNEDSAPSVLTLQTLGMLMWAQTYFFFRSPRSDHPSRASRLWCWAPCGAWRSRGRSSSCRRFCCAVRNESAAPLKRTGEPGMIALPSKRGLMSWQDPSTMSSPIGPGQCHWYFTTFVKSNEHECSKNYINYILVLNKYFFFINLFFYFVFN